MVRRIGKLTLVGSIVFLVLISALISGAVYALDVSKTSSTPGEADDNSFTREFVFGAADFPAGALVEKVTISLEFAKIDNTSGSSSCDPLVTGSGTEWNDELYFWLTSPSGAMITLISTNTYTFSGFGGRVTVTLDDSAGSLPSGIPTTATFLPREPLATFNGTAAQGTWVLTVGDNFGGDPLCFYSATLNLTVADPPPTLTPTNTPEPSLTPTPTNTAEVSLTPMPTNTATAVPTRTLPPPPDVPFAEDVNFDAGSVVYTAISDALVDSIHVRTLYRDGQPVQWQGGSLYSVGSIGVDLTSYGIQQAVDIFSAGDLTYFNGGAVFCLRGEGTLVWLAASGVPRHAEIVGSYTVPDYPGFTCITLFEPGTLVLLSQNPLDS